MKSINYKNILIKTQETPGKHGFLGRSIPIFSAYRGGGRNLWRSSIKKLNAPYIATLSRLTHKPFPAMLHIIRNSFYHERSPEIFEDHGAVAYAIFPPTVEREIEGLEAKTAIFRCQ